MNAITRRVRSSASIKNVGGSTPSIIHVTEDPSVDQVGIEGEPKGQLAILIKDGVDAALFLKTTSLDNSWVAQGGAAPAPAVPAVFEITITDIAKLNGDVITFAFPLEMGSPVFTATEGIDYVIAAPGPAQASQTLNNLLTFLNSMMFGFSAYFTGVLGPAALSITFDGASAPATQLSMDAVYVDKTSNLGPAGGYTIISSTGNTVNEI